VYNFLRMIDETIEHGVYWGKCMLLNQKLMNDADCYWIEQILLASISGAEHYENYNTERSIQRTINSKIVWGVCDVPTRDIFTDRVTGEKFGWDDNLH